jgi:hypothetical protein
MDGDAPILIQIENAPPELITKSEKAPIDFLSRLRDNAKFRATWIRSLSNDPLCLIQASHAFSLPYKVRKRYGLDYRPLLDSLKKAFLNNKPVTTEYPYIWCRFLLTFSADPRDPLRDFYQQQCKQLVMSLIRQGVLNNDVKYMSLLNHLLTQGDTDALSLLDHFALQYRHSASKQREQILVTLASYSLRLGSSIPQVSEHAMHLLLPLLKKEIAMGQGHPIAMYLVANGQFEVLPILCQSAATDLSRSNPGKFKSVKALVQLIASPAIQIDESNRDLVLEKSLSFIIPVLLRDIDKKALDLTFDEIALGVENRIPSALALAQVIEHTANEAGFPPSHRASELWFEKANEEQGHEKAHALRVLTLMAKNTLRTFRPNSVPRFATVRFAIRICEFIDQPALTDISTSFLMHLLSQNTGTLHESIPLNAVNTLVRFTQKSKSLEIAQWLIKHLALRINQKGQRATFGKDARTFNSALNAVIQENTAPMELRLYAIGLSRRSGRTDRMRASTRNLLENMRRKKSKDLLSKKSVWANEQFKAWYLAVIFIVEEVLLPYPDLFENHFFDSLISSTMANTRLVNDLPGHANSGFYVGRRQMIGLKSGGQFLKVLAHEIGHHVRRHFRLKDVASEDVEIIGEFFADLVMYAFLETMGWTDEIESSRKDGAHHYECVYGSDASFSIMKHEEHCAARAVIEEMHRFFDARRAASNQWVPNFTELLVTSLHYVKRHGNRPPASTWFEAIIAHLKHYSQKGKAPRPSAYMSSAETHGTDTWMSTIRWLDDSNHGDYHLLKKAA